MLGDDSNLFSPRCRSHSSLARDAARMLNRVTLSSFLYFHACCNAGSQEGLSVLRYRTNVRRMNSSSVVSLIP